jgi:hypothetical protein
VLLLSLPMAACRWADKGNEGTIALEIPGNGSEVVLESVYFIYHK